MSVATSIIRDRFRGALVGVLVGDCFGAPFESRQPVDPVVVNERFEAMTKERKNHHRFTDDTAMTISTCRSLIENRGLDPRHLAKAYSQSYFNEPRRGYGQAVTTVFKILKDTNYQDPFGPASAQFDGRGSYGNGAAMRCVGIGLFAQKKNLSENQTISLTENCSRITHTHIYGIHGAVLLVLAVKYVLALEEESLNENDFLEFLIQRMSKLEAHNDKPFTNKLRIIANILVKLSVSGTDINQAQVVNLLGNDVSAHNSVPLAIYSFLRGISKFNDSYRLENEFIRTLHWAVSCGGDTDTIASMACGLSGAYLGLAKIPENFYDKCESYKEMLLLADQLSEM